MFLEDQISKLERFLKLKMTRKTGVMDAEQFSFAIIGINYILKYTKTILKKKAILNCNNISSKIV